MTPTTGDLSLFTKKSRGQLTGLTGAYVDDTLSAGDTFFEKDSRITEAKF